ncbi:hypothetical protein, partial [Bradyrhizobium tropiciagri]|uniref:hypothetical protein n=1 Tax=Bradyrhizobium tropiciagri TaxID=312253 RepID=UPI001BA74604
GIPSEPPATLPVGLPPLRDRQRRLARVRRRGRQSAVLFVEQLRMELLDLNVSLEQRDCSCLNVLCQVLAQGVLLIARSPGGARRPAIGLPPKTKMTFS